MNKHTKYRGPSFYKNFISKNHIFVVTDRITFDKQFKTLTETLKAINTSFMRQCNLKTMFKYTISSSAIFLSIYLAFTTIKVNAQTVSKI